MNATLFAAAAGTLAGSALARADIQLVAQLRELSVQAHFYSGSGTFDNPIQSSAAPDFGPWADSIHVSTLRSNSAASLTSAITSAFMTATGSANGQASPFAGGGSSAQARSHFRVDFSVDSPTLIQYHAALPVAHPQPTFVNSATLQNVWVLLINTSTGQTIAHVRSGWGLYGNYPTTEPPVNLSSVLAPGSYEIDALLDESGFSVYETNSSYSDSATFEVSLTVAPACYANCDASTVAPILNIADFDCFLNHFAAGDAYANCDSSTTPPVLNVSDFVCFLNKFAAGCT